jgi:hypothetical protein
LVFSATGLDGTRWPSTLLGAGNRMETASSGVGPGALARTGAWMEPPRMASAVPPPAEADLDLRTLRHKVLRVLRVGVIVGSGFEADLVGALLGVPPLRRGGHTPRALGHGDVEGAVGVAKPFLDRLLEAYRRDPRGAPTP